MIAKCCDGTGGVFYRDPEILARFGFAHTEYKACESCRETQRAEAARIRDLAEDGADVERALAVARGMLACHRCSATGRIRKRSPGKVARLFWYGAPCPDCEAAKATITQMSLL